MAITSALDSVSLAPQPGKNPGIVSLLVFNSSEHFQAQEALFKPTPKHQFRIFAEGLYPDTTIYSVDKIDPKNEYSIMSIKEILSAHIAKFGALDQLVIASHGRPGEVQIKKSPPRISISKFVQIVEEINAKFGSTQVRRLVFGGCNVFTRFSPQQVADLRNAARKNRLEIVGSAQTVIGNDFFAPTGLWAQFTPKGEVILDKLNETHKRGLNPFDYLQGLFVDEDNSWLKDHLGRSQEEGAKMQYRRAHPKNLIGKNL